MDDTAWEERFNRGVHGTGLAAILAWRPAEVVMAAGTFSHLGMTLCLLVPHQPPVLYLPSNEPVDTAPATVVRRRYTVRDAAGVAMWADLQTLLARDLEQLGVHGQPIGYAAQDTRDTLAGNGAETSWLTNSVIQELLADQHVVDATAPLTAMMLHKTDHDLVGIRRASTIAAVGLQTFATSVQSGRTEAEIAGLVEGAIQARSGKEGCQSARGWAFVQAGANTEFAGTYSRSSGKALAEGDLVVLELGTCVDGYWSDLTRTLCVGTPSPQQAALLAAVHEAQAAAIATIRPGTSHEAVDHAAREVLTTRGYGPGFAHATGHHVGFRYHDVGPMLASGSTMPLIEGMVVTVEPGAYGAAYGGGARREDNVYVGPTGAVLLSPDTLTP